MDPLQFTCHPAFSRLLGSIAVAAYSYMALVPLIQTPYHESINNSRGTQNQNGTASVCRAWREDPVSNSSSWTLYPPASLCYPINRLFYVWKLSQRV